MFDDIRKEITRNFLDIKLWVSNMPDEQQDSDFFIISRGLFFVYVYGVFEEIIRQIISETISKLNSSGATVSECIFELYSLIFSPEYDGLYCVGNDHKWDKRWAIASKFQMNPAINIPGEVFPTDGKNIRYRQLESIANSFGMKESILPRSEIRGYIEEMVDNRNAIAHGDKLPKEVGGRFTKDDLLKRIACISEVCLYTCAVYERYILEGKYLKAT